MNTPSLPPSPNFEGHTLLQALRPDEYEILDASGNQSIWLDDHQQSWVILSGHVVIFALHAADGTPMMLTDTREAAVANAWSHELEAVSVH